MLGDLNEVIALTAFDAAAKRRLRACARELVAVLDAAPACIAPLITAAATDCAATCFASEWVFSAPRWPASDRSAAVRRLAPAIEAADAGEVVTAAAVMLGVEGVADLRDEFRVLTARREQPLVVILAALGSRSLATVITITTRPARVLH
jgi:hypothetical protein